MHAELQNVTSVKTPQKERGIVLKDIMEGAALLETVPAVGQDGWQAKGRCARHPDPDLWFAPIEEQSPRYAHLAEDPRKRARKRDRNRAKELCRACPVRAQCLRFSLEDPDAREWGMWGGLDKAERTKLRNMLAAKDAVA
jgi:WhiB family transcriptional regulator, redox-sensing transcriptional regulator